MVILKISKNVSFPEIFNNFINLILSEAKPKSRLHQFF